jgi:glycosyltransferase involved in cell wall biosynthesis
MNILIVAYWHDPRFKNKPGGLIRMFELADNLIGLGHHVTMVLPKLGFPQTQTRARVVSIPFLDLPFLRPLSFQFLSSICILLLCLKKVNLLYVRQMNSFLPLLIANLYGVSSYFEIPNDPYIDYLLIKNYKQWLVKLMDKLCMCLCDRVVVLSEWSKGRINAMGGIPLSNILVFPSGTDTELFHPMGKEHACMTLGLDPICNYVGFIGSFLAYQGIDILLDAAPLVLEKIPNTQFLLVGDGPMRVTWGKRAQEGGLQDHFIFTGHVPYREVPNYVGAMDVCVAPHRQETNQASPVKLFDYMASGRPIVASDIEVVREIVADSGCAILIPPNKAEEYAKAIITLLEDDALRGDMGDRGRKYSLDHYDRKKITAILFNKANNLPLKLFEH